MRKILFRLTIVPFFLFGLALFMVVMPVKYLITGQYYFDSIGKFYTFYKNWSDKLGL